MAKALAKQPLEIPTEAGIVRAHARLRDHLQPTPCYESPGLSRLLGFPAILKVETINPIGCFKLRGALNSLLAARETATIKGACTSSTGNHGQGVALAANYLGLPAHIFVPKGANPAKMESIRRLGGHLHVVGRDIDEAKAEAVRHARSNGLTFVDDGEDLEMMHGAGTVGLELVQRFPDVASVFVPMGSGTLAAGVAAAVKTKNPKSTVTTVQSDGSPAMTRSFHERRAVEHPIDTIADGLVCRVPARRALDAILHWIDDAVLVPDRLLLAAMHTLLDAEHLLLEPSGAAALAGAWTQRADLQGKRVALILTGSNLAPGALETALQAPRLAEEGPPQR